jgi:hypothetical protein
MRIQREDSVVLQFTNDDDFKEVNVVKNLFSKLDERSQKAGFKREFTSDEIDLIRAVHSTLVTYSNTSV